jgi:hypothetical protein
MTIITPLIEQYRRSENTKEPVSNRGPARAGTDCPSAFHCESVSRGQPVVYQKLLALPIYPKLIAWFDTETTLRNNMSVLAN